MPIPEHVRKIILANKPKIIHLDLSGDCVIGLFEDDVDELVKLLEKNDYIISVNLSRNVINNDGAKKLAILKHIKEFNLSSNNIDDDGIIELLSSSNIQRLDLSRCGLTNKCVDMIIHFSHQKEIVLSDNKIDDEMKWKAYNHLERKNQKLGEDKFKRMLMPSTSLGVNKLKVQSSDTKNVLTNQTGNIPGMVKNSS